MWQSSIATTPHIVPYLLKRNDSGVVTHHWARFMNSTYWQFPTPFALLLPTYAVAHCKLYRKRIWDSGPYISASQSGSGVGLLVLVPLLNYRGQQRLLVGWLSFRAAGMSFCWICRMGEKSESAITWLENWVGNTKLLTLTLLDCYIYLDQLLKNNVRGVSLKEFDLQKSNAVWFGWTHIRSKYFSCRQIVMLKWY